MKLLVYSGCFSIYFKVAGVPLREPLVIDRGHLCEAGLQQLLLHLLPSSVLRKYVAVVHLVLDGSFFRVFQVVGLVPL